jgi:hypothetical protein
MSTRVALLARKGWTSGARVSLIREKSDGSGEGVSAIDSSLFEIPVVANNVARR